jgi:hypothetical protein
MERLLQPKRTQYRFTDNTGNQGFILYYSDNGVEMQKLIEHAFFFPNAVNSLGLNGQEKAQQFGNVLQAPANAKFAAVLAEQIANGVNDLDDILQAYIADRMGKYGQRAAYRQLDGLKHCKKSRNIKCFEWEILFETANNITNWVPGPEAAMIDETLRRAYLESVGSS